MLVTVISGFKASVQTELNAFFAHLAKQADLTRKASAQAFSKANLESGRCRLSISINLMQTISWCLFAVIQRSG